MVSSDAAYLLLWVCATLFFLVAFEVGFSVLYRECRRFRRFINRVAGVRSKSR